MWFDVLSAMWLALVVACAAEGGYRQVACGLPVMAWSVPRPVYFAARCMM